MKPLTVKQQYSEYVKRMADRGIMDVMTFDLFSETLKEEEKNAGNN